MMNKNHLVIQRIIGKIDNDFNIDNSDWIPRCAAWIIDALSQLKVLPKERKSRKLEVEDRIAIFPCAININSLKVYDSNGCEIPEAKKVNCCGTPSTDKYIGISQVTNDVTQRTIAAKITDSRNKNYVIVGDDKIELNFDDEYITIESLEIATYYDEYFNCEVPYIYDDGLLIEALTLYCIYKMLCRGYKHQVFSLGGPEPVNPYIQWINIKDKASASVINSIRKNKNDEGWNNFFYNSTFLPRNY